MFTTLEEATDFGRGIGREVREAIENRCAALEAKIQRLEAALAEKSPVKYMGTFKSGAIYSAGSLCTHGGSLWHANKMTREPPGNGMQDWVLCVKSGRDGKDAR